MKVAERLIEGGSLYDPPVFPSLESVESLYDGILESAIPEDREPIADPKEPLNTFRSILPDEIEAVIKNWAVSAPGADGITVPSVKSVPSLHLSILFSSILVRNVHPTSWTEMRTVLVPKSGNLKEATNWRPITIGSAVQRLMHPTLNARLRSEVSLNLHQRGFTECDGTLANTHQHQDSSR